MFFLCFEGGRSDTRCTNRLASGQECHQVHVNNRSFIHVEFAYEGFPSPFGMSGDHPRLMIAVVSQSENLCGIFVVPLCRFEAESAKCDPFREVRG